MGIKNNVGKCPSADLFSVLEFTKTTIRLTCNRTGLFQECMLTRKGDHYVHGRLIEFGESRFEIRISLKKRTVTLLYPRYGSWEGAARLPNLIAHAIASMLLEKKSTKAFTLERHVVSIAN